MKKLYWLILILVLLPTSAYFLSPTHKLNGEVLAGIEVGDHVEYKYVGDKVDKLENEYERGTGWVKIRKKDERGKIYIEYRAYQPDSFVKRDDWRSVEVATTTKEAFYKATTPLVEQMFNYAKAVYYTTWTSYANSGDGHVYKQDSLTWSTVRDASSGTANYTGTAFTVRTGRTATPYYSIYRAFLSFDTQGLPDDNFVVSSCSVRLYLNATALNGYNDGSDYITLTTSSQANNTTLVAADYDNVGRTAISNTIDLTSLTAGYKTFTLTSGYYDTVSTTAYTKMALQEGHDLLNSTYDGSNNTYNSATFRSANYTGTTYDPYMVLVYYPPTEWLKPWAKRGKLEFIYSSYVLSNLPVAVPFTSQSDYIMTDMRWMHDKMGENIKKSTFTEYDGITELYGEIEKWDNTNREGLIWVGSENFTLVPTSGAYPWIYMYFDDQYASSYATNTVGYKLEATTTQLWGNDFVYALTLNDEPNNSTPLGGTFGGYSTPPPTAIDADFGIQNTGYRFDVSQSQYLIYSHPGTYRGDTSSTYFLTYRPSVTSTQVGAYYYPIFANVVYDAATPGNSHSIVLYNYNDGMGCSYALLRVSDVYDYQSSGCIFSNTTTYYHIGIDYDYYSDFTVYINGTPQITAFYAPSTTIASGAIAIGMDNLSPPSFLDGDVGKFWLRYNQEGEAPVANIMWDYYQTNKAVHRWRTKYKGIGE